MDREKFQQKALKQTKQKKSKSAEFLMVKGDREVTEGIGNPAFNTSSPDLSAHQTSKEKVIRHDVLNHTLAAHQQKCRLPACVEPKGNEYSRNYFDPLMEEEINPRQCRMEVSREDERTKEETSDSESHVSSGKIQGTNREAPEARPAVNQECERHAQRDIILLASPLVEQDLKVEKEGTSQDIPMSCLKKDTIFENQPPSVDGSSRTGAGAAELAPFRDGTGVSTGPSLEGAQAQLPCQRLKIYIKCIRSLKDKVPQGSYFLRVSLLDRPGSGVLQEWQTGQMKARTRAVRHGGHFYEVGLCWQESLSVVLPQRKAVIMGWTFLFELVLHRGKYTYPDQVVGWALFPVCDNNFHVVEGKFKCLLLRGHYDQKLASFRKIEDLICHDLDHWLCNLYFQVNKLPLPPDDQKSHAQLSPELPGKMVRTEEEKLGADNTACGLDEDAQVLMDNALHSSQGSLCNKIEPCPRDCDLHLLKEVHGLDSEGHHCSSHSVKKESPVCRPGELEDFPQDSSYLEELEKHRYSVWVIQDFHLSDFFMLERKRSQHDLENERSVGAEGPPHRHHTDSLGGMENEIIIKTCTIAFSFILLTVPFPKVLPFDEIGSIRCLDVVQVFLVEILTPSFDLECGSLVAFMEKGHPNLTSPSKYASGNTVLSKDFPSLLDNGKSKVKVLVDAVSEEIRILDYLILSLQRCSSSAAVTRGSGSGELFKHLYFAWVSFSSGLELAQWKSQGFWYLILLMTSLWFLRLYLHYLGQWLFLQAISTPVTKFHFHPHTVDLCYPTSSLLAGEELAVIVVGPLMLNAVIFLLLLIRWGCQLLFSSSLDALSKLIITMGLWTVLDPLAVFIVDIFLGRFTRSEEAPTADAAKLYWLFVNIQQPPILGAVITVGVYVLLSIITSLIVYLYCLRLNNDSWILDVLQRIHSEETKFFIPHDLEISNQELSSIVKRAEQWRGLNGERRKVAVYDYICSSHGTKSSVSSCDLRHPISASALGPGEVISHVSVYNVYPSGFQELHRHFLRLPDGTIVEVFGDISALTFVPCDVVMAIEEHIREVDTVQRETAAAHEEEWKGTKDRRCPFR
uniref:uncharacterized protein LOC101603424 n=1 Tax=Jaculus jaculus TaxID=51337 RepID=UPI001E1B424E|nr:uncharacterized protein LOC101603424 [Jaculus jaculus]